MLFCLVCEKNGKFCVYKRHEGTFKEIFNQQRCVLKLPLFCIDPACEGWGSYASVKIFMQHVVKYQKDQFSDATISLNDSNCCNFLENTDGNEADNIFVPNLENCDFYDKCVTKLLLRLVSNSSIPLFYV